MRSARRRPPCTWTGPTSCRPAASSSTATTSSPSLPSATSHRLISPRTRTILFVFIFFYLLLIGGAFVGIMAAVLDARPDVPFGILVLAAMGMLGGWLLYRRRADLIAVTVLVVVVTLVAMASGV